MSVKWHRSGQKTLPAMLNDAEKCREIYMPFWLNVEILFDLLSKTQVGLLLAVCRVKGFFNIVFKSLEVLAVAESDSFIKSPKKVFISWLGVQILPRNFRSEVFAQSVLSFYTKYLRTNTNTCCFKTSKYKYSKIVFKYS